MQQAFGAHLAGMVAPGESEIANGMDRTPREAKQGPHRGTGCRYNCPSSPNYQPPYLPLMLYSIPYRWVREGVFSNSALAETLLAWAYNFLANIICPIFDSAWIPKHSIYLGSVFLRNRTLFRVLCFSLYFCETLLPNGAYRPWYLLI